MESIHTKPEGEWNLSPPIHQEEEMCIRDRLKILGAERCALRAAPQKRGSSAAGKDRAAAVKIDQP